MGGLIGLDYNVLFKMAELLQIKLTRPLLHKIKALEATELKRNRDISDTKGLEGNQKALGKRAKAR